MTAPMVVLLLRLMGAGLSMSESQMAELSRAVVRNSELYELDPVMVVAIIREESHFDVYAMNPWTHALGLMQVMRGRSIFGFNGNSDQFLMRIDTNVMLGTRLLASWRDFCRRPYPRYYLSVYDGRGSCVSSSYSRRIVRFTRVLHRSVKKISIQINDALLTLR